MTVTRLCSRKVSQPSSPAHPGVRRQVKYFLITASIFAAQISVADIDCQKHQSSFIHKDQEPTRYDAPNIEIWLSHEGIAFSKDGPKSKPEILGSCNFGPNDAIDIHLPFSENPTERQTVLIDTMAQLNRLAIAFGVVITSDDQ